MNLAEDLLDHPLGVFITGCTGWLTRLGRDEF